MHKIAEDIPPFHDEEDRIPRTVISIPGRGQFRVRSHQVEEFKESLREAQTEEELDRIAETALVSELGVTRARVRETFPDGLPNRSDLELNENEEPVDMSEFVALGETPQETPQEAPQEAERENVKPSALHQKPLAFTMSMIGTDPTRRRYADGTVPGQENLEDFEPDDFREDELAQFAAAILGQGERLKRPGGYIGIPQPTKYGKALLDAKRVWDERRDEAGPVTRTLSKPLDLAQKGVIGIASVLRSTFEGLGMDFPDDKVIEILGPGGEEPIESAEVAKQTGSPNYRDVSEPSTLLTEEEWENVKKTDPAAVQLYRTKRLLDATWRGTLAGPLIEALVKGESINDQSYTSIGAQISGEVAPPRDKTDVMLDLIGTDVLGPMLPSVVAFPGFAAVGARFGATRMGTAAAKAIGTPGRLTATSTLAGAGAGGSLGYMLHEAGVIGEEGTSPWSSALKGAGLGAGIAGAPIAYATRLGRAGAQVSTFTRAFAARAPQFFATAGAEGALGSVYGAAYGGRAAFESGHTDEVAKQTMLGAVMGGVFGFGFALPFRSRAMTQSARAGIWAERMAADGVLSLEPGTMFNPETGLMFGGTRKNGSIFWQVKDPETGRVRFARKEEIPDELAVHDWLIDKWIGVEADETISRISSLIDKMPAMEKVKARQHTASGEKPMDTPLELTKTEELAHLVTLREINYMPYAFKQVSAAYREGKPQALQNKIDTWKTVARTLDDDSERHIVAELLGRARAIERVRAKGIENITPVPGEGEMPRGLKNIHAFEAEKVAYQAIADWPQHIRNQLRIEAEVQIATGNPRDLRTIQSRQVLNALRRQEAVGHPDPDVVRAASKEASRLAGGRAFRSTRGLNKGSKVMYNGELAEVLKVSKSSWGQALVRQGSADPIWVNTAELGVLPKTNRHATLADGTPVKVIESASDGLSFKLEFPDGKRHWIDAEFIESVGDHKIHNNMNRTAFNKARRAQQDGKRAPKEEVVDVQPRAVVDKQTGEKVTVKKSNNSEHVVETTTGEERVVAHEDVGDVPTPDSPIDEIYTFGAGTKPAEGKNIVFVRAPKVEASIFAEIMRIQGDRTALLDVLGGDAHIFPTPPREGEVLFAVEIEPQAKPNASGRKALGVLSGKHDVDDMTRRQWENLLMQPGRTLTPEELANARIYEVPKGLHEYVLEPDKTFDLTPEEKMTYISKLTDMSFETDRAVAAARARGKRQAELIESAKRRNRGDEAAQAERGVEQAQFEQVRAVLRQDEEILDAVSRLQERKLRTTAGIRDTQESQALLRGDLEAVRNLIDQYPAVANSWDVHPLVFDHPDIPGARLALYKIGLEDVSSTARRIVNPQDNTSAARYLLEEISEDGTVLKQIEIGHNTETMTTEVPARPAEGIRPKEGDIFLAVSDDGVEIVQVMEIEQKPTNEGTPSVRARVKEHQWDYLQQMIAARKELPSGRVIYEGMRKPTKDDPRTHLTEAEAIHDMQRQGFGKFKTEEIAKFIQGKGLEAKAASIRQSVGPEGKERLDTLQKEIKELKARRKDQAADDAPLASIDDEIAMREQEIQQLPEQYPQGRLRVRLMDRKGQGYSRGQKGAQEEAAPFTGLAQGDVMPARLFNSKGKQVRLYKSLDPADHIERIDVPRRPSELAQLSQKAAAAEASGAGVAVQGIPYRVQLTPSEVLDRVMEVVGTFDTRANAYMNGVEWRSGIPGLYATTYADKQGRWIVNFWNTAAHRRDPQSVQARVALGGPEVSLEGPNAAKLKANVSMDSRAGEFSHKRTFPSRASAERFLQSEGFFKPERPEAPPKVDPTLANLVDKLHDTINELADALPNDLSPAEVMGAYKMSKKAGFSGRHPEGMSAKAFADRADLNAKQISNIKGRITRQRNELVEVLRQRGFDDDLINGAIRGSRQSAKDILAEPAKGGVIEELEALPHWESIQKKDLNRIEDTLIKAWTWYATRNNGYVPPELRNYMFRYAKKRWEFLGGDSGDVNPPFDAHIRQNIGYIVEQDLVRLAANDRGITSYGMADPEIAPEGLSSRTARDPGGSVFTGEEPGEALDFLQGRRILSDDMKGATSEFLETAAHLKKFHDDIVDRSPIYKVIDEIDDPSDMSRPIEEVSIARLKLEDGEQLVQITSYDFDNASVTVLTPEGTFHEVGLDQISVVRSAKAKFDYVRHSKIANNEPYYMTTTKQIGSDPVDKALKVPKGADEQTLGRAIQHRLRQLLGVPPDTDFIPIPRQVDKSVADLPTSAYPLERDRSVALSPENRALYNIPRPDEAPIRFTPKGYKLHKLVSPDQINELLALHVRSVEIGRPNEVINRLPKPFQKAFRRSVYDHVIDQRGEAPLTYIEASVKSGLASKTQLRHLAEHAAANGIESSNPIVQLDGLIKQNALDPNIGKFMVELDKQAGFLGIRKKINAPNVDISPIRRYNDIHKFGIYIGSHDYAASRHAGVGIFNNLIWDGQIRENQLFENLVMKPVAEIMDHYGLGGMQEVTARMTQVMKGKKARDLKAYVQLRKARELLSEYSVWDDVVEAFPDIDPGVRFAFERFREMTQTLRNYAIQSSLRQGRTWVQFKDLAPEAQARMARSFGQTIAEFPPESMVVDHYKHAAARRTRTEAARFIELLDQFDSAADIPANAKKAVPSWMIDEFDLWKNFGIKNYWPQIHRGKIRVMKVNPDGQFTTIAWARNGAEVNDSIRRAIDQKIISPSTVIKAEALGFTMDDMLMNVLDSNRFDQALQGLMKAANIEPARASEILAGTNIRPASSRTTLQNLELRQQDLASMIDNPLEEMQIYGARVVRNQYLLDVDEAFTWLKKNDRHISEAFGEPYLNGKQMPNLVKWLEDAWATAKGETGTIEKYVDDLFMTFDFLASIPPRFVEELGAEGVGVLTNPEVRQRWMNSKFHEAPYRSKNFANDIASVHGTLKLGFTPSAALVNLSQLAINTYPVLGEKYFGQGLSLYRQLRRSQNMDPAVRTDLANMLDEVGVKYQRSIASARTGLQTPGETGPGIYQKIVGQAHHPRSPSNKGIAGLSAQMTNEVAMFMFESAEQVNRSVTAIGAYQKAMASKADGGLGLSRDAAIQFAKNTVKDTQFHYFDSALPRLLRGPVAKVMMQFKPYLYNQVRFEMNMIRKAMRRDPGAIAALAKHVGAIGMLGGARAFTNHPVLGPLVAVAMMASKDGEISWDRALQEPYGIKPPSWISKDLFNHGLAGLLNISIANRVGITGTDLQFWQDNWGFFAGPQGSLVSSVLNHQLMVAEQRGGKQHVGINAGAAFLTKGLINAAGKKAPPLSLIGTALAMNEIQSRWWSDTPGREVFASGPESANVRGIPIGVAPSTEAEQLVRNLLPKVTNDFEKAGLIWGQGLYYDTSGRPIHVPATGVENFTTGFGAFVGFQPTIDADRLAAAQIMRSRNKATMATRRAFLEAIARASIDGDAQRVTELKAQALEMDILIEEPQIREQKRQLTEDWYRQFLRGLSMESQTTYDIPEANN